MLNKTINSQSYMVSQWIISMSSEFCRQPFGAIRETLQHNQSEVSVSLMHLHMFCHTCMCSERERERCREREKVVDEL